MTKKSNRYQVFRYQPPKEYDLVITYGWFGHGVCGHTFEMLEYYFMLREHYRVCIVSVDLDQKTLEQVAFEKYNISSLPDVFYTPRPRVFDASGQVLLITDGSLGTLRDMNYIINAKHTIGFRCGKHTNQNNLKNYTLLMDFRVYNDRPSSTLIDYTKKIHFSMLRKPLHKVTNTALIYATPNCREILDIDSIKDCYSFQNYIVIQDKKPILDLFDKIDTYIYTPIGRQFDCSPRLIAEMKYFGKQVIYHSIDYTDAGLEVRQQDLNAGIDKLQLTNNDSIIGILSEHISSP
jgi:hypothetical protein